MNQTDTDKLSMYDVLIAQLLSDLWTRLCYDMSASRQNGETYTSKDFFAIAKPSLQDAFTFGYLARRTETQSED